jgi:hypothetical protein
MSARGTRATDQLTRSGVAHVVREYEAPVRQGAARDERPAYGLDAAAALGVEPDRIFKTLVATVDALDPLFPSEPFGPYDGTAPAIAARAIGAAATALAALEPKSDSRMGIEKKRVRELVPPVVKFPYIKMGRSISGFRLNKTGGKFGPFDNQLFLGDYSLSLVMRATTEQINGVWQGACYPFREGLATGIMNVEFSPKGQLMAGGFTTSRQWPVRGTAPFALQRIDWNGITPFEIQEINIRKDGFRITFTEPVDPQTAAAVASYRIVTYTHVYHGGYGSPEVDHTTPKVLRAVPSADGRSVNLTLNQVMEDHIHDFDLAGIRSQAGRRLVHNKAYYTVNEIPTN